MSETAEIFTDEHEKLEQARALVAQLEAGEIDDAMTTIAMLSGFCDSQLYQDVGRLTRELHDSINDFVADSHIADIAQSEMPDAAERLNYVINMTEEAANTTLGAVEEAMPLADTLKNDSLRLYALWEKFNARKMTVEDFRELNNDLGAFLQNTQNNSQALNTKLSEVLMAQGYQDLSGQIIRKVIDLVGDVEGKLIELVRISGAQMSENHVSKGERDITAAGPRVPGVDKDESLNGQKDVDDLLSSLGF